MTLHPRTLWTTFLPWFPRLASLGVIAISGLTLVGWALDFRLLTSGWAGIAQMPIGTAISLLLSALALMALLPGQPHSRRRVAGYVCASLVCLLAALPFFELRSPPVLELGQGIETYLQSATGSPLPVRMTPEFG